MPGQLQDLVQEYRKFAAAHGKATREGDPAVANRNHDRLVSIVLRIRDHGKAGGLALAGLTEDPDDSVVCWAATHLLRFDEAKAVAALRQLSMKPGIIALVASTVLQEWEKGELRFPW